MNLNAWRNRCHKLAVEKGFWDEERNDGEAIALMHSELSEALEALRVNNLDGKDSVGEELADCIIRILDYCGGRNIDIEKEIEKKMKINERRPRLHGKRY